MPSVERLALLLSPLALDEAAKTEDQVERISRMPSDRQHLSKWCEHKFPAGGKLS